MKRLVHLLSAVLVLSVFAAGSLSAQCVEVSETVGQLSTQLVTTGGVCPAEVVQTATCDCPAGYVAVGYEGTEGNSWGGMVLSEFSLRCRELNEDGSLGGSVVVTCSNGTVAGNNPDGPIDAGTDEALVGFQANIGCAVDGIRGFSKAIADVAAGSPNTTSNMMTEIGGMGGSPQAATYVPDGSVIVGMQTFEDPNLGFSGGVAWRYAALEDVACDGGCNISDVSVSNVSGCDDGGTADDSSDDTFTADITITYFDSPMSGELVVTGDALLSVDVAAIGATSYTFSGVTMAANGGIINLVASFSAQPDCKLSVNAGQTPDYCSPDAPPPAGIPTMSEWGLIIFGLIIFTLSLVFGLQFQRSMSLATSGQASGAGRAKLPFSQELFFKVLPYVYLTIAAIFVFAIVVSGYELTNADIPGSIIAGGIVAYLLHFVLMNSKDSE